MLRRNQERQIISGHLDIEGIDTLRKKILKDFDKVEKN